MVALRNKGDNPCKSLENCVCIHAGVTYKLAAIIIIIVFCQNSVSLLKCVFPKSPQLYASISASMYPMNILSNPWYALGITLLLAVKNTELKRILPSGNLVSDGRAQRSVNCSSIQHMLIKSLQRIRGPV